MKIQSLAVVDNAVGGQVEQRVMGKTRAEVEKLTDLVAISLYMKEGLSPEESAKLGPAQFKGLTTEDKQELGPQARAKLLALFN